MDVKVIMAMLDAMAEVVDDHQPWKEKVEEIHKVAKSSEKWDLALGEFLAWFEEDDD